MAFDEHGYICPYNDWCRCQVADCDVCGWNPVVAEKRMEKIKADLGIQRVKISHREIDAVELTLKLGKRVRPLVDTECSPGKIYSEVMKCVVTAPTLGLVEVVRCKDCVHLKACSIHDIGNFGKTDFCPYGKRCEDNDTE